MNKYIFILTYFIIPLSSTALYSQEKLHSIDFNSALADIRHTKSGIADTVPLPFFDDFANPGPKPLPGFWTDDYVYVNNHYEFEPISTGVATFDGLDNRGHLYPGKKSISYPADVLTSQPINLEGKTNVSLTFFYQPQGKGTKPENGDSLILQFKPQNTEDYITVWKVDGSALKPFSRVYIPVQGDQYLYNGFQFRFKNHVSISSDPNIEGLGANTDYWNLDYVFLDENIAENDSSLFDVCFKKPVPSILHNFRSLPWRHFDAARLNELKGKLILNIRNFNDEVIQSNVEYRFYELGNPSNNNVYSYNPFNLIADSAIDITQDIVYDFQSNYNNKGLFGIKCHFKDINANFNRTENDTIYGVQQFFDYYAFDDGTPEAGYGFQGIGSENSMFAFKHKTFKRDTLTGIYMYFNPTIDSSNHELPFMLSIWSEAPDGTPGDMLFEKQVWSNALKNEFIRFETGPENLILEGSYFIGWQQTEQNTYLNVGFDKNSENNGRAYINTNGVWESSAVSGVVMIRPAFGTILPTTSEKDDIYPEKSVNLYPVPAKNSLTIERTYEGTGTVELFDLQGKLVHKSIIRNRTEKIHFDLKKGMYLLRLIELGKVTGIEKIIISN